MLRLCGYLNDDADLTHQPNRAPDSDHARVDQDAADVLKREEGDVEGAENATVRWGQSCGIHNEEPVHNT